MILAEMFLLGLCVALSIILWAQMITLLSLFANSIVVLVAVLLAWDLLGEASPHSPRS